MTVGIWGNGLIGQSLASALAVHGVSLRIMSRSSRGAVDAPGPSVEQIDLDLYSNDAKITEALKGLEVLVHCAGSPRDVGPAFAEVCPRIAKLAIATGIQKVIVVSTVAVYGNAVKSMMTTSGTTVSKTLTPHPNTDYAKSRFQVEEYFRQALISSPVQLVIVRIPMVLPKGLTARPLERMRSFLKMGFYPFFGSSTAALPFVQVERLAAGLAHLSINVKNPEPLYQFSQHQRWLDIYSSYEKVTGVRLRRIVLPGRFLMGTFEKFGFNRFEQLIGIMMNEAIYLDDLEPLLRSASQSKIDFVSRLILNADPLNIIWTSK